MQNRVQGAAVAGGILVGALALAGLLLHVAVADAPSAEVTADYWAFLWTGTLAYGLTGAWVARMRPRLPIGWVLLAIGTLMGAAIVASDYGLFAVEVRSGLPAGPLAVWLGTWLWAPAYVAVAVVLPLIVPDGHLLSRRWRPALGLALSLCLLVGLAWAVTPYDRQDVPITTGGLSNPVGLDYPPWAGLLLGAGGAVAMGLGIAALFLRWHRARGVGRLRMAWVALGVLATLALLGLAFVLPGGWGAVAVAAAMVPLPASIGVAILRYGLWDVEVVLSRSLVYGALTAIVVSIYVAVVGLLGGLLGATTGAPILATAIVAVVVAPLHGRLLRAVNRLVHGDVDDPGTLLRRTAAQLADTRDPTELAARLLPELTERVARVLRAPYAAIETEADGVVAEHGARSSPVESFPLEVGGITAGSLLVEPRPGGLGAGDRRLLERIAQGTAVAAHAAALARDLRRSRERLVVAVEEERKRLHRELHDELGPALAAAALQVETARDIADSDPDAARRLLDRAAARLQAAVDDVRDVVAGLRPTSIDELGLSGAVTELGLRFHGSGLAVDVETVGTDGPDELPAAVDVAAYRIVSEALANAARHSGARRVHVRLSRDNGDLVVEVVDDGRGIPASVRPGTGLASMRDRAAELGGRLDIARRNGGGTVVRARLPMAVP